MEKEIEYKKQGDGRDSWTIREFDSKGNPITAYVVYEDPEKTLSEDEIQKLKLLIK